MTFKEKQCIAYIYISETLSTLNFYAPEIEDRGHIVFVLSVIMSFSETLTLLITLK